MTTRNSMVFPKIPLKFHLTPNFSFPAESHGEALASLRYGINEKKGFILLLGEAGIGKTTLLHYLMNTLDSNVKPIFFPQSQTHFEQMLSEMLLQLGLPSGLKTKGSMIHELNNALIECLKRDETVAIIIDEAQNIGLDLIEEVRLLANLETRTSKLLQIVLVGQPELQGKTPLGSYQADQAADCHRCPDQTVKRKRSAAIHRSPAADRRKRRHEGVYR